MKRSGTAVMTARGARIGSRGFLPDRDPLVFLPKRFGAWEEAGRLLPKLLASGHAHRTIRVLPPFDVSSLRGRREVERAMSLLSFLGHAWVWGGETVMKSIPERLAVPWYELSRRLGRPPVLSYASYALNNWRRIDPEAPVELGNLALIQNFLGGLDEEWFVVIHVAIEACAAPALHALPRLKAAVRRGDAGAAVSCLETMEAALSRMCAILDRMPENCDPYIYFRRVRPYIHGWKDIPALPKGLVYEGVAEFRGRPRKFRGETGAQSSIIPSLDGALGIVHREDPLRVYLAEMREYMPPEHRRFIEFCEGGGSTRDFVVANRRSPGLRRHYNGCVRLLDRFRRRHLEYAAAYIQKQARAGNKNPTEIGTGGTPFMPYLSKHQRETSGHLV